MVQITIDSADTFTQGIKSQSGEMDISVRGTFSGSIVIQRKPDGAPDSDYAAVGDPITGPAEKLLRAGRKHLYRIGSPAGLWSSGTAIVNFADR